MIKTSGIYLAVVFSLVISGCVSTPQVTPAPTSTPAPTVTPTPVPTPVASVEVLQAPKTVQAGKSFQIRWRVNSDIQTNITHTAVHYGPESKSEPLTLQSYPNLTTPQGGMIPADFSANLTISSPGTIYFRAHAIINTVYYWSPEMTLVVNASPTPVVIVTSPPSSGGY